MRPHSDDEIHPASTVDNKETAVVASNSKPLGAISHTPGAVLVGGVGVEDIEPTPRVEVPLHKTRRTVSLGLILPQPESARR